jgi:ABC-type transport system substrate-binding protein
MTLSGVATPVKLRLRMPGDPSFTAVGETIQSQLSKIGIDLELIPSSNLHADMIASPTDLWINAAPPIRAWQGYYRPVAPVNYCKQEIGEPIYVAGNERAGVTLTDVQAKAQDKKFQEMGRDTYMFAFLFLPQLELAYTKNVQGIDYVWSRNGGTDGPQFATVSKKK